jgi:hypothetical protein
VKTGSGLQAEHGSFISLKRATMNIRLLSFTLVLSCAMPAMGYAQGAGCTDPQAINYNAADTVNDGSCMYAATSYSPVFIANLASALNECSGVAYINGELWSHNDGGNPNEIYRINTADGSVMRTVVVANAVNTDWESMTQNEEYLFVGDFGNNNGNRTDLTILKIRIDDIASAVNDTVQAAAIHFSYEDQVSFASAPNNNNYDCEAFFFANDSLHLFSKNWVNLQTKHYVLPADTGTYVAQLTDSFNVDGLVTDAAINDSGTFVLLGYKDLGSNLYACFAWLMFDYPGIHECFSGNKRRIELGLAFTLGQTEGITFFNDNTGYISSEKVMTIPPMLHSFNFSQYLPVSTTGFYSLNNAEPGLTVYQNMNGELVINNAGHECIGYKLADLSGRVVNTGTVSPGITKLDTAALAGGIYFLTAGGSAVKVLKL